MLPTKQPVLRRFWYLVMPGHLLTDRPVPFRLLGEDIVLWRDEQGTPAAIRDRCCHRTAKLSRGFCENGQLVCGYHGWRFNRQGRVVRVPQANAERDIHTSMRTNQHYAAEKYGYIWVALDEPFSPIPDFEEDALGYRKIEQFYDTWECGGLRFMENSFDTAHIAFVHRGTFGDVAAPQPASSTIEELADGFVLRAEVPVVNGDLQKQALGLNTDSTTRSVTSRWYMPFLRKSCFAYPHGLVHSIVTASTPIDDNHCQVIQFCYRNDTAAQVSDEDVVRLDKAVVEEDRFILESTDWNTPLDVTGFENNMVSDQPGLLMRKKLGELLAAHNEQEVVGNPTALP